MLLWKRSLTQSPPLARPPNLVSIPSLSVSDIHKNSLKRLNATHKSLILPYSQTLAGLDLAPQLEFSPYKMAGIPPSSPSLLSGYGGGNSNSNSNSYANSNTNSNAALYDLFDPLANSNTRAAAAAANVNLDPASNANNANINTRPDSAPQSHPSQQQQQQFHPAHAAPHSPASSTGLNPHQPTNPNTPSSTAATSDLFGDLLGTPRQPVAASSGAASTAGFSDRVARVNDLNDERESVDAHHGDTASTRSALSRSPHSLGGYRDGSNTPSEDEAAASDTSLAAPQDSTPLTTSHDSPPSSTSNSTLPAPEAAPPTPAQNSLLPDNNSTPRFNFQAFLAKMREPSASTLVKPIRDFIGRFTQPVHNPDEAVQPIRDFLDKINHDLANHELWRDATDADLEYGYEGMEKYIMSKLYQYVFQPPHSDDVHQDQALTDRMKMLAFIKPEVSFMPSRLDALDAVRHGHKVTFFFAVSQHLEISAAVTNHEADLAEAQTELIKIDSYRSPRDKLLGEAGYYLTNMQGAARFIQTVDSSQLAIEREEFDMHLNAMLEAMHGDSSAPPVSGPATPASSAVASQSGVGGGVANKQRPTRPPPPRPNAGPTSEELRPRADSIMAHHPVTPAPAQNARPAAAAAAAATAARGSGSSERRSTPTFSLNQHCHTLLIRHMVVLRTALLELRLCVCIVG
ncbi:uncharacterized protein MONBRDRAFT_30406 [Monosiga brevicollis MX1]|uniref:RABX5 catalytic core helical domain-containing protein n=1 Tax=Monosiga brevicollis TaxID=81824 RepID=A9VDV7_MONBE|nr:uncharacterized protein MONBRDRAFT_30406 [Monosiga brevicollis MX1]EDQ84286.1 predicted protein [Monosiga brevicollis MX1]|eukprot:XP_001750916.1 hypothetical protein [Monosiga brevicollis MX1]